MKRKITSFWNSNVWMRQDKLSDLIVQRKSMQSSANWETHHGRRGVNGVACRHEPLPSLHHIDRRFLP